MGGGSCSGRLPRWKRETGAESVRAMMSSVAVECEWVVGDV